MTARDHKTIPLEFRRHDAATMVARADELLRSLRARRSVRHFSAQPIPLDAVRKAIETAAQSPSGANKQPWTFVLVTDPALKRKIREAAEQEEEAFYGGRAPQSWLDDLAHLGTDHEKPFLEVAPALVVVFQHTRGDDASKHYYVKESVGIATGVLLAALHHAGLATLTHTPSPMGFLQTILQRPPHEKAYMLIPVGLPAPDCRVPAITRKPLGDVLVELHGPSGVPPS